MSDDFKELKMFQCKYCMKIFHTANRHQCKFKPEFRNCFSCMNCSGIAENVHEVVVDRECFPSGRDEEESETKTYTSKYTVCNCGNGQDISELANRRWKLNCPNWKEIPNYTGKETYVRRVIWHL